MTATQDTTVSRLLAEASRAAWNAKFHRDTCRAYENGRDCVRCEELYLLRDEADENLSALLAYQERIAAKTQRMAAARAPM